MCDCVSVFFISLGQEEYICCVWYLWLHLAWQNCHKNSTIYLRKWLSWLPGVAWQCLSRQFAQLFPQVCGRLDIPLAASTAPVIAPLPIEFQGSSLPRIPIKQQSNVENNPPHTAKLPAMSNRHQKSWTHRKIFCQKRSEHFSIKNKFSQSEKKKTTTAFAN